MYRTYSIDVAGRELSVEIGRLAELANGAALVKYGDTVVLATATASEKPREGIDFFPLSVNYEERLYSVGKIPGGFIKREGRPSENAVLTSRVIDRPIRPLFPEDYRNDVAIVITVLSVDQDASPEVAAMIASSIALTISDIPFNDPLGSCIVGRVDGEFVINPNAEESAKSEMSVTVSSTAEKVMMIEASANEVEEDIVFDAIKRGFDENVAIVKFIDEIVAKEGLEKQNYEEKVLDAELYEKVKVFITDKRMEEAVFTDLKQIRDENISVIKEELVQEFTKDLSDEDEIHEIKKELSDGLYEFQKATVRRMILKEHKRPDGRKLNELRKLESEVDILPRTHGSAIFKRGQTQVLTITTLGALSDAQRLDGLDLAVENKRYMHHYNFPSFSVGETRPSRGPGRREIGHGVLAENALLPVLPSEEDFPYAIRLVSEVVSSNGSTSQASVCASSLSLMAAGVPVKRAVAGISVGLVTGENEDDYVLLTDIQGLEDFFGDMDFKVAGSEKGITAIQMDMKIKGLSFEIIKGALEQTKIARDEILNVSMASAIKEARTELSPYAPNIISIQIDPEKISEVIGARGKTIKRIIEETSVDINIDDSGLVSIISSDAEMVQKAKAIVEAIVEVPEPGNIYSGKITRLMNFGVFVEFAPEKEGLVHISKLAHEHVKKVEDVVKVGDIVKVKVLEVDNQGRVNLSIKDLLPKPKRTESDTKKKEEEK